MGQFAAGPLLMSRSADYRLPGPGPSYIEDRRYDAGMQESADVRDDVNAYRQFRGKGPLPGTAFADTGYLPMFPPGLSGLVAGYAEEDTKPDWRGPHSEHLERVGRVLKPVHRELHSINRKLDK